MTSRVLPYLSSILLSLLLSYSMIFLLDDKSIKLLTTENGFFETFTAIFFLIASIFFLIAFLKNNEKTNHIFFPNKNLFFFFLFLLCFIACMEEISWGQQIFKYQSPELITKINQQNELNFHNLMPFHRLDASGNLKPLWTRLLTSDRLFFYFYSICFFVIPILNKTNYNLSKKFKKINLPIAPIWVGFFIVTNYLFEKILKLFFGLGHTVEIQEFNAAVIFIIISMWFMIEVPRFLTCSGEAA